MVVLGKGRAKSVQKVVAPKPINLKSLKSEQVGDAGYLGSGTGWGGKTQENKHDNGPQNHVNGQVKPNNEEPAQNGQRKPDVFVSKRVLESKGGGATGAKEFPALAPPASNAQN